ncbi:protein yipf [Anaeramoeba flamelloides]|uniref:Protein YIPF n=1 Tax=Anaeramoeba flamelloides TaxID=1746091 RepID=A0AAV8A1K3_9EUKA|nr:protein yipf [Anaeramoeba flamelloides]
MSEQTNELIFDFNEQSQPEQTTINQETNPNNNNNQSNQTDFYQSVYTTDNIYSEMPRSQSFNQISSMGNNFENEPPLLEELEINFDHIKSKMLSVLNPFKPVDTIFINDSDLAGPLIFCLLLGFFLLFRGKINFGYIYGLCVTGCSLIYFVLNLMSQSNIDLYKTVSVSGYCLLPIVFLSFIKIFFFFVPVLLYCFAIVCVIWATYSATNIFVKILQSNQQKFLIAYPVFLFYACFAVLTIF